MLVETRNLKLLIVEVLHNDSEEFVKRSAREASTWKTHLDCFVVDQRVNDDGGSLVVRFVRFTAETRSVRYCQHIASRFRT